MAQIIKTFARNVTTAGTAVPLSTSKIYTTSFAVRAKKTNSGDLYIGNSDVTAANGMYLQPQESNEKTAQPVSRGVIQLFDLSKIYMNAASSGDGAIVEYLAEEPVV